MGPGQVVICHLDKLGVKKPDDGDVVCLQLSAPKDFIEFCHMKFSRHIM